MKTLKDIFGIIIFAAFIWHLHVYLSKKREVTGFFETKPKAGYVWTNDFTHDARAFWKHTDTHWQEGEEHPNYNVVAASVEDRWTPKAGYQFTTPDSDDLTTFWKENVKHPTLKAYSSSTEGEWLPQLGYKFVLDEYGSAKSTVWDAGRVYSKRKIMASDIVGRFNALPGYSFPNPKENLDVVWTPGLTHPDRPGQIASTTEGVWDDANTLDASSEGANQMAGGFLIGLAAHVAEWAVGKNDITDAIKEEAAKEVVKGGIKALSN